MIRVVLFLLIPLSCFSQKRLVPSNYNHDSQIETHSMIEDNGITVFAECIEASRDIMIFDIEVQNNTGRSFEFDPEEIYYYQSDAPLPDSGEKFWEHYFSALSKENYKRYAESRKSVQEYYRKKIRSKENTKTMLAVLVTAMIVYDAVKDGQDFNREPTKNRVNKSIARDITLTASMTALDIVEIKLTDDQIKSDEDLYYLAEEYLQTATLADEASARGKVYFSKNYKHEFYRIMVPVENSLYSFDFRWPTYVERQAIREQESN